MISRLAALACLALVALGGCGSDDPARDAPALAGTSWRLDTSALAVAGGADVKATLDFERDAVGGSDGCNRIFGPYEQDGASLTLGPLASTQMACPGAAGEVAAAVGGALAKVASFTLEGDRLTLEDAGGEALLVYER